MLVVYNILMKCKNRSFKDMTGKRYGRLTVVSFSHKLSVNGKPCSFRYYWNCVCDCGNTNTTRLGKTMSCGCLQREKISIIGLRQTHGMSKTIFYKKYKGILRRCNNKKDSSYKNYGARGINCEWISFEDFRDDMYESYTAHCNQFGSDDTTIDRIDSNGNYSRSNCRWATYAIQTRNYSRNHVIEYNGERLCLTDLAKEVGIKYATLRRRLKCGWSLDDAVSKVNIIS